MVGMHILKRKSVKVLREISNETEGITLYDLGRKLNYKYFDSLTFNNFNEFILINVIVGRIVEKEGRLFITEKGKRLLID